LKLLRFAGLGLFTYLIFLAARVQDAFSARYVISAGILIWATAGFLIVRPALNASRIRRILLVILLLGGLARFLWAISVPTRPVSDFRNYHEFAVKLAQDEIPEELSKNPGYPLLLSISYRIEPAVITGKLLNAALSTLTIYLLFLLGSALSAQTTGLLAAFLFAILPAEINMVSVLGAEVAATMLITAATLALVYGCQKKRWIGWVYGGGLLFGIGITVRSSLVFLAPLLLGILVFIDHSAITHKIYRLIAVLAGTATGLLLLAGWHSASTGRLTLAALQSQDAFPFLSGTNIQAEGGWNEEDARLYFSWPASERDQMAITIALQRVRENPLGMALFIPHKIATLMGDQTYGNTWSIYPINWRNLTILRDQRQNILDANRYLNQAVYILLLTLAVYHFLDYRLAAPAISAMAIFSVILIILPHTILEVQSRYHHIILPYLVLVAGQGLLELVERNPRARIATIQPNSQATGGAI
jgi:hypothetical protein